MELLFLIGLFGQVLGKVETFDTSQMRHAMLTEYCQMIKNERIYKTEDLEKTCVMKVSFFNSRVSFHYSLSLALFIQAHYALIKF